jgi:putative redox protein
MKIVVDRVGPCGFEAKSAASGATLRMEGPPDLGGTSDGLRPMETLLASLAGCSAVDVVMILGKQKEPLEGLSVEVEAERADAIPAVFTKIHLRFVLKGPVAENKARRAVALSAEKYCSVSKMLEPTVAITHEVVLEPGG